jgi:hypothetical protein
MVLQLSDIKSEVADYILPPSSWSLDILMSKNLDMDVYLETYKTNLQRGYVWSIEQKRAFVIAILRGVQIPPILVVMQQLEYKIGRDRSEEFNNLLIIDGKQRLSTLIEFREGKFSIIVKGQEYVYENLATNLKNYFSKRLNVPVSIVNEKLSDDQLIDLFEYCNFLGTEQDINHIKKVKGVSRDNMNKELIRLLIVNDVPTVLISDTYQKTLVDALLKLEKISPERFNFSNLEWNELTEEGCYWDYHSPSVYIKVIRIEDYR